MQRVFLILSTMLVLVFVLTGSAAAQEWPAYASMDQTPDIVRGPGFYFSLTKLMLLIFALLLWARSTAWLAADVDEFGAITKQDPVMWKCIAIFTFVFGFLALGLTIPIFLAGYPLVLICWAGPIFAYLGMRDGKVAENRRVLTAAGMQRTLMSLFTGSQTSAGPAAAAKQPWEMGPAMDLAAVGAQPAQNQAAMIEARQSPAFVSVKRLIEDAFNTRGEKVRLDFTAEGVAVRYMVDGLWHPANPKVHDKDPLDRTLGDAMLMVLKRVAHLNPQDRRAQQKGKFQITWQKMKFSADILSQGTKTGEAVMLSFTPILKTARTLEELGMREKMRQQLKELVDKKQSLLVVSSMPGDGLTTEWMGVLKMGDRLLRDFVTVEHVNNGEPELVENIEINKYDPTKGQTAAALVYTLKLRQPDVYLAPSIENGDALQALCEQIEEEEKSVILSTRAREAVEALVRLLALKPDDPEKFIGSVSGVLNQRLIRKLCETCREAVPLSPELAQRLRIPAGRVQVLYREKQPLPPGQEPPKGVPAICPACNGLGYKGRVAIYELLVITDQLREVMRKKPQVEVLRQYAAKGGHPSLQEEGILLVASGVTSLAELQRVLKQ